jgi:hypothetical protein
MLAKLGNAVIISDERYRTGPDTGLQLNTGQNVDAGLTFSLQSGIYQ